MQKIICFPNNNFIKNKLKCSIKHNSTDIKRIIQLVLLKHEHLNSWKMDRFSWPLKINFEKWILLPKYYDIFYFIAWIKIFYCKLIFLNINRKQVIQLRGVNHIKTYCNLQQLNTKETFAKWILFWLPLIF